MFQSIVNVFNNSSNKWNIEQLRKILKIPQDQLKILENIPGWTSSEKEKFEDKIAGSFNKKSKQKIVKNSQNPKKVKSKKFDSDFLSNISSFSNLKTKEISLSHDKIPLDTDKSLTCPDNRNKFSIVRSLSLSSLNNLNISNNKVLKRSFSTSTLNTDYSFDSDSDNSKNMSSIIHPVFKGVSNVLPISSSQNFCLTTITADKEEEKSQFVNSAVQCQMSQCSQPELENNDCATGIRIVKSQNESSVLMINASCNELNFELKNKSDVEVGLRKPIVDTDISVNSLNTHSQKIETSKDQPKGDTPKLHATDDENFISQPIPCAQPSTSASKDILFSSIQDKNVSFEISDIPDTIKKVEDISEKKVNAIKRKRKNKQEKLPKKFCAMKANEIKILYSLDQIGDMVKAIKLLTHV